MKISKSESSILADVNQNNAPRSAGAQLNIGRETSETGKVLGQIGQRMTEAQAFQESTEASTVSRAALNDLILKVQQDPDPKNHDKYIKEIDKVKSLASKNITLRSAKNQFESDFSTDSNTAIFKIKSDQRKKVVDRGQQSITNGLRQLAASYVQAGDPREQKQMLDRMNMLIEGGEVRGFYTPQEAAQMKANNFREIAVDKFYFDLKTIQTPDEADQMMDSLKSGAYETNGATIDPEKKNAMYGQLEKAKTKLASDLEKATKSAQNDNEAGITGHLLKNDLPNINELDNAASQGLVDKKFVNLAVAASLSEFSNDENKVLETTEKLMGQYAKIKTTDDWREFRNQVLIEKPNLNEENFSQMLQWAGAGNMEPVAAKNKLNDWINGGLKFINNFKKHFSVGKVMVDFVSQALDPDTDPKDIPAIAKEVVDNQIVKNNPRRTQYEVNQIVNVNGGAYRVTGYDEDGEPLIEPAKGK